jgi:hypothetical protein
MRKVDLQMSVSIEGFVGGPGGEINWLASRCDRGPLFRSSES